MVGKEIAEMPERDYAAAVAKLAPYSTPNLADGMNRFNNMDGSIHAMFPCEKVAGPALTVRLYPADNSMLHKVLAVIKPGDVLVVDTKNNFDHAVMGELLVSAMKLAGLAAIIVDGYVRDLQDLIELGVPVWAKGTSSSAGGKCGLGEINTPACCGGIPVMPGDIIVADVDGVVCVPFKDVDEVAAAAEAKITYEAKRREEIAQGILVSQLKK